MSNVPHLPKPAVPELPDRRARTQRPAPTPDEIRRQLGWGMTLPDFKPSQARS